MTFEPLERVSVEAFDRYHAENPHIYEKLVEYAMQAARRGVKRLSVQVLYGRLRWFSQIETVGDPWKLNDHYTAFYARKLMAEHKALEGMFELRRSVADGMGPKKIMREIRLAGEVKEAIKAALPAGPVEQQRFEL